MSMSITPHRIIVTGDHHGVELIPRLAASLRAQGHAVETTTTEPREDGTIDYPPLCAAACRRIQDEDADLAIVLGGSGQGEVVACNKMRGIRAGVAYSEFAVDISRGNNNANVMVIGAKVIDEDTAHALVRRWLMTPFKGGVHAERIAQITELEEHGGF